MRLSLFHPDRVLIKSLNFRVRSYSKSYTTSCRPMFSRPSDIVYIIYTIYAMYCPIYGCGVWRVTLYCLFNRLICNIKELAAAAICPVFNSNTGTLYHNSGLTALVRQACRCTPIPLTNGWVHCIHFIRWWMSPLCGEAGRCLCGIFFMTGSLRLSIVGHFISLGTARRLNVGGISDADLTKMRHFKPSTVKCSVQIVLTGLALREPEWGNNVFSFILNRLSKPQI